MDTFPTLPVSGFKVVRTDSTEVTVTTFRIVERIDVFGNITDRERATLVDVFFDALLLQATEERFCYRIVPAIAFAAHAWL